MKQMVLNKFEKIDKYIRSSLNFDKADNVNNIINAQKDLFKLINMVDMDNDNILSDKELQKLNLNQLNLLNNGLDDIVLDYNLNIA